MKSFVSRGMIAALALALGALPVGGADEPAQPVTPDALPEARALLATLYAISGKYILTGQHNYPNVKSRNSEFAAKYTGKTPVIFGTDFGFAKPGDTDSYLARPDIVQEAIRQHHLGAIVAICWHAVPPTADEPVTFRPLPNSDPKALASIQGKLLDQQFKDVLTPGTALYEKWCAQVDAIAVFLKQLEDARVPVLWRPYHEMNGDWFWWGGRTNEGGTIALYRQIFDRLVHHHHLKNLLWVWSMDRVHRPEMEHAKYFPGIDFVDVLALDVYQNDFAQAYYDSLVALAQGKPLALAEVGNPPTPEILTQQPRWTYFMTWAGMVRNTPRKEYDAIRQDPRYLGLEDPAYARVTAAYRQACGLPLVHLEPAPADFSGTWVLNQDDSTLGRTGAAFVPARLDVVQHGNELTIRTTRVVEYADDQVTEQQLTLDGAESHSEFMNAPLVTTAHVLNNGQELALESVMTPPWGPAGSKMTTRDHWTLTRRGDRLSIERVTSSPRGDQTVTMIFDRR